MREARPNVSTPARLHLRVLGDDELTALHERALRLIADDGVLVEGEAAGRAFEAAGAVFADGRARLAPEKVEDLLSLAPSSFTLSGRADAPDRVAGDGRPLLATGGPAALALSAGASSPRPATGADLAMLCRLVDAVPEVAVLCGPPVQPARETPLGALQICLAAATTHVHIRTLRTADEAEKAALIAEALAGSPDEARERPPLSLSAPLEVALAFARHGLPVSAAARLAPAAASSDPAEAAVRRHAATLAACAAVQAVAPGTPFLCPAAAPGADLGGSSAPGSGAPVAADVIAAAQLAACSGLPVLAPVMLTRAPAPDWQACSENALASLTATLAGVDVIAGAGTLAGGAVFSGVALVLDAEIHSWNAAIAAGIQVDAETVALDAIRQVGIGGNYLGQRHTRTHMKDVWRPRLLDRSSWDAWVAGGRKGAPDMAAELVQTTLADHTVPPLEAAVADRINEIITTVQ